ncbi:bifunctional uridylyltransferase/uridylyl-removing enzyme [bacterium BMS3Abin07]|nr:bifunctional uridylyltransferase/uridylyl-removing enzyme [bacterium BMS3Abin07]GBE31250.1 bifunctional uridylyltransferase/uridylyl-removing enzyme [bacterium BMS3Bbin05]
MIGNIYLEKIKGYLTEGWGGRLLASYCTSLVDNIIFDLLPRGEKDLPFAVFATGSYGRTELCPFSDIDIMFFSADMRNTDSATGLLYGLWDRGLQVSHSFRTPRGCIKEAFSDLHTRTSMLEARFICGNPELERIYREEVLQKLRGKKKREYISSKLREIRERRRKQGRSPFLLQPDVKESCGGLRDIQSALWLTSVLFKYDGFQGLKGLMREDDYQKYLRAYDFMLKLRFVIHVLSRRKNDRLLFELQEETADMLGIRGSKKFSAVERMMRYYFIRAGAVSVFSDAIYRRCGAMVTRRRMSFGVSKINDNFSISKKKIIAASDEIFRKNPVRIMEAFYVQAKTGYELSDHLLDTIKRNIIYINAFSRKKREMVDYFFSILRSGRVGPCLRSMHATGVLDKFIPEFGALRHLLVNSYYHEYPVDEHSLMCIEKLETIERSNDKTFRHLSDMFMDIHRKDLLYLALLLHDIGKAKGRYHEREGYKGIKNVADRLMLDVESRVFLESLVKNHILMSEVAFKHDVESPDVQASFAEKIVTVERLKAIYLMTYADMSSVSDSFWTRWRASILQMLYVKTRDYLRGARVSRDELIQDLVKRYQHINEVKEFIDNMPDYYFISSPQEKIRRESILYKRAVDEGFAINIEGREDGTTEITLVLKDRAGVFSGIVSVFAVRKLNIIEARLFTSEDGFAVDRIKISNWNELWWEGMDELIESDMRDVLIEGRKYYFGNKSRRNRGIESFIEVDNEKLPDQTVIEIMAPDREGLLYEVAEVFSKSGVNITSGRIYTEQDTANDVFYINYIKKRLDGELLYNLLGELWQSIKYQKDI